MDFCVNCMKEVNYTVEAESQEVQVKDEKFSIELKIARCADCGEEIFVKEIDEENFKKTYDMYKTRKGLLTSDEIKSIREKYNLTQSQFAKILSLGEKTITRYENGSIQESSINTLIELMSDENVFKAVWEKQKLNFSPKEVYKIEKNFMKEDNSEDKVHDTMRTMTAIKMDMGYYQLSCSYAN